MRITKENYEEFILDYLEGKLDPDLLSEFRLFFEANPEIREEIESFEIIELSPSGPEFSNKDSLKKKEIDLLEAISPFEKACIAAIEQDLDETASEKFHDELMRHPEKGSIFQDFSKTILKPEPVSFDSKNALKKPVPIGRRNRPLVWYAVASVILLILLIRPFMNQVPHNGNFVLTEQKNDIVGTREKVPGNQPTDNIEMISKIASAEVNIPPEGQTENNRTVLTSSGPGKQSFLAETENMKFYALSGKSEILPHENINSLALHAPVIYIPVYLDVEELKILETLTVSDFKVRIIQKPEEHKSTSALLALFRTGIKKLNKNTGSDSELMSPVNDKGILTAFVFDSPNFKIRRKGKEKAPKTTPDP
jgi:hypothetical protein